MCGRFTCLYSWDDIRALLGLEWTELHDWPPSYNVAPTQTVPVVVSNAEHRPGLKAMTWGFPPARAKGASLINARSETLRSKPTFREAFNHRRCLVPTSGFYEWQRTTSSRKQPWSITPQETPILLLAGIYRVDEGGGRFVVVTAPAEGKMAEIHHRAPVMLEPDAARTWLDREPDRAAAILQSVSPPGLTFTPISTRINSVTNNDPSLIEPIRYDPNDQPGLFTS